MLRRRSNRRQRRRSRRVRNRSLRCVLGNLVLNNNLLVINRVIVSASYRRGNWCWGTKVHRWERRMSRMRVVQILIKFSASAPKFIKSKVASSEYKASVRIVNMVTILSSKVRAEIHAWLSFWLKLVVICLFYKSIDWAAPNSKMGSLVLCL